MEFTTDELEIINWALDDHITKVLVMAGARRDGDNKPNLAFLDTRIIQERICAEIARRRKG